MKEVKKDVILQKLYNTAIVIVFMITAFITIIITQ